MVNRQRDDNGHHKANYSFLFHGKHLSCVNEVILPVKFATSLHCSTHVDVVGGRKEGSAGEP